uniref:Uncharacterized protein n=1 Tax=Anguilla anguilla TaxID=7936 RepID=A0A0E9Q7S3_ANGAN
MVVRENSWSQVSFSSVSLNHNNDVATSHLRNSQHPETKSGSGKYACCFIDN